MNFTTTVTSRGQVTIPKAVRKKLGLRAGTRVAIYPTQEGFVGKIQTKQNKATRGELSRIE